MIELCFRLYFFCWFLEVVRSLLDMESLDYSSGSGVCV